MAKKIFSHFKYFDWILFFLVVFLSCFGLIEIYSIALGRGAEELINFKKQFFFFFLAMIVLMAVSFIDYKKIKDMAMYLYILGILILSGVLFWGETVKGTTGWFDFRYFNVQPVEIAKIILIITLARFFFVYSGRGSLFKVFWSGIIAVVYFILVNLQPDFGSAIIFFFVWLIMLFFSDINKKYFLFILILATFAFGGLWGFYFKDYQKERIVTFINPRTTSIDTNYNTSQALIAVGSGGLMGRGVGFGTQSQLKFLPEAQNDFIFAVIAEEFGLLGCFLLILFFSLLFYRGMSAIRKIEDDFGKFFIAGAMGLIFTQMFINISMNIGLLPIVGINLPFISYGGSSLISFFALIGIMENIIINNTHSSLTASSAEER